MQDYSDNVVRSKDVVGKCVIDNDNKLIGNVEEIALDNITGQVHYAILSFNDSTGQSQDYYAIPWRMLEYCMLDKHFKVQFSQEFLKSASGLQFKKDKWPDFTDYTWLKSMDEFCGNFYNHFVNPKSPMVKEQKDFISEGGNSQPLNE